MPEVDDSYPLDEPYTLIISDVGTATPSDHAASHASDGDDPITIAASQVTGLGTMSAQAANNVSITGGAITGVTITTNNATISGGAISGVSFSSNNAVITGGSINNVEIGGLTPQAGAFTSILASTGEVGDLQISGTLTLVAPLGVDQGGTNATNAADARTNLGLGSMSTQAKTNVDIDGGAIDNTPIGAGTANTGRFTTGTFTGNVTMAGTLAVTGAVTFTVPLPIASGGTGANTAALARTALGLQIGLNVQAWDDLLDQTVSQLGAAGADEILYVTTPGSVTKTAFKTPGRLLLAEATMEDLRTVLGVVEGSATLILGSVTIAYPGVVTGSKVTATYRGGVSGTPGHLSVICSADQIIINSSEGTDSNDVNFTGFV